MSKRPKSREIELARQPSDALGSLAPTIEQARKNKKHVRAKNTLIAYEHEWKKFVAWCTEHGGVKAGIVALPARPEVLALYVAQLGTTRKPSGINVALAAVAWYHREARVPSPHKHPDVLDQIEALRRKIGTRPNAKTPLTDDVLVEVVSKIPGDLAGLRDRALLLLCWTAGFRRSEVVYVNVQDLTWAKEGVVVFLGRSKTDQAGEGVHRAVPLAEKGGPCPVRALQEWLQASGIREGAVFRSLDNAKESRRIDHKIRGKVKKGIPDDRLTPHNVAVVVKQRLEAAGIQASDFSGHSLRAGLATSAARAGRDVFELMATLGWKKADMAVRYVREANMFRQNAAKGLL